MRVTMATVRLIAAGMALTAINACGTSAAPDPTVVPSPTAMITPTPSPTPNPYEVWKPIVEAAGLTAQELGGGSVESDDTGMRLTLACNRLVAATTVGMHYWNYRDAKPAISDLAVHAYHPESGTAVVDQARAAASACKTWEWGRHWKMEVLGELAVTAPAGADNTVAYCQRGTVIEGTNKGSVNYHCNAFMSRGNLVFDVRILDLTLGKAQSELKMALPVVATAARRALPSL